MNKQTIKWLGALVLGGCLTMQANAESIQKLGFINTERIYRETTQAQSIQKTLEKEFSARQAELEKMQQQGLALERKVAAQQPGSERDQNIQQLNELKRKFLIAQAKFGEEYNLRRNEEFAALQQNANKAVIDLAKKNGYDLILQDVVFIDSKFDITDDVIKAMNR